MGIFDQGDYEVRFEWGPRGVEVLGSISKSLVIVDVLSFTTCVTIAVDRGASIIPYGWDENNPYSRSPESFLSATPGECIKLASHGSHLALLALETGAVVFAGALLNARAVAAAAGGSGATVAVIAAGERWPHSAQLRPAVEDLVGAGAIISRLTGRRSPEADVAVHVFENARSRLKEVLGQGVSGKELIERGSYTDVDIAARLDVTEAVGVLRDGIFEPLRPMR